MLLCKKYRKIFEPWEGRNVSNTPQTVESQLSSFGLRRRNLEAVSPPYSVCRKSVSTPGGPMGPEISGQAVLNCIPKD